jgi:hypothetical protein
VAQPTPRSSPFEAVTGQPGPTPDLGDDALDRLAARYAFRRPEEVVAYLGQYPQLVPILFEAAEVIPRYFGADAPLVLEVFTDPEGEADDRELFAIVRTALGSEESLERLYRLQDDWWLAASPDGPGVLVIGIEPG